MKKTFNVSVRNIMKFQINPSKLLSKKSSFLWNEKFKHFPDKFRLLRKEFDINSKKELENEKLLNELIAECGIHKPWILDHGIERKFLLTVDIRFLKKMGVVSQDIAKNLVNTLNSFEGFDGDVILKDQRFLTIKKIRNSIEKEFLGKEFQVDPGIVESVMVLFNPFIGRSIRSVVTKLKTIKELPSYRRENINQNIFLLNIKPFNSETLSNFKDNLLGYDWGDVVRLFPGLGSKPYPLIMLFMEVLEKKGFTEAQIRRVLPYLTINLRSLIIRLNYLLEHPDLSRFRTHEHFLGLLCFSKFSLHNLVESEHKTFSDLQNLLPENHQNGISRKNNLKKINCELTNLLNPSGIKIENLKRHPNLFKVPLNQIKETVSFLKERGFTKEEISESVTVILYPRENIMKALEKISEEKDVLEGMGFKDGCVPENTTLFSHGTKLKRKTLQLCLYYMELEHGFSGNGVFQYND